ncbi:MAG: NYN domain-containing protein [Planctomycetota bacterium]
MHETYLVDGFNLFHQWPRTARFFKKRENLPRALARAAALLSAGFKGHKGRLLLALDGGLSAGKAMLGGLAVHYAGPGNSADEVILDKVREAQRPGRYIVVTDDRTLRGNAHALGARTLTVKRFLGGFRPEKPPLREEDLVPLRKHLAPTPREVEEWLAIFGQDADEEGEA